MHSKLWPAALMVVVGLFVQKVYDEAAHDDSINCGGAVVRLWKERARVGKVGQSVWPSRSWRAWHVFAHYEHRAVAALRPLRLPFCTGLLQNSCDRFAPAPEHCNANCKRHCCEGPEKMGFTRKEEVGRFTDVDAAGVKKGPEPDEATAVKPTDCCSALCNRYSASPPPTTEHPGLKAQQMMVHRRHVQCANTTNACLRWVGWLSICSGRPHKPPPPPKTGVLHFCKHGSGAEISNLGCAQVEWHCTAMCMPPEHSSVSAA